MSFFGAAAGIEAFLRGGAFQHLHVRRENGVQRVRDALGRDLYPLRHGKVAHLPRRVYARIRPAAARDAGKKSEPLLQGAFQLPLHRTAVVLHLPAAEIRPVVADF